MDPNSASERPVRNGTFFFDDDPMAIFLVENQLFKAHRHPFIKGSEVFRDMFANAGGGTEGTTEDQPIPLPDVTVQEFEALLRFFYVTSIGLEDYQGNFIEVLAYEQEEMLALLSIAHRFNFINIFRYIGKEITPEELSVLDRVHLGDKYDINEWLLSAYKEILDREEVTLTKEESKILGLQRVNRLLQAKNSMLHERLKKVEPYINSYMYSGSRSTKEVVKQYFASGQAEEESRK